MIPLLLLERQTYNRQLLHLKGFIYYFRLQFQNGFDFMLHVLHIKYLIGAKLCYKSMNNPEKGKMQQIFKQLQTLNLPQNYLKVKLTPHTTVKVVSLIALTGTS